MSMRRRDVLKGAGAAGAAALAGTPIGVGFAGDASNDRTLVYVFLRGGMDGLHLVAPMDGHPDRGQYEVWRSNLQLPSGQLLPLAEGFGFHPAAQPLMEAWNTGDLGLIQAVGLPEYEVNRSHFEAQRFVELGTPGDRTTPTGWLTRFYDAAEAAGILPPTMLLPTVVTESVVTFSLLREPSTITLPFPSQFDLETEGGFEEMQEDAIQAMYALGGTDLDVAGEQALTALTAVEAIFTGDYTPANGAVYPTDTNGNLTNFAAKLQNIARLIKNNVGLKVAQADRGGWDTHNGQINAGSPTTGWFADNVTDLAATLAAFRTDLQGNASQEDFLSKVLVVVESEFGRPVVENNDLGTDHGWGNLMLMLGKHNATIDGGFHGEWPGLQPSDIFQDRDLFATTDYRNALSNVLVNHMGLAVDDVTDNSRGGAGPVFPGFGPGEFSDLGVVLAETIMADGFESA